MKMAQSVFILLMVCAVSAFNPVWGQERNLGINKAATAKIRAFDREYFKGFDVYSAGVEDAPAALLFDIKDAYQLSSRFWGEPLSEEEIVYAIHRLDQQSPAGGSEAVRFVPRALNVVNVQGAILGYCYTGLNSVPIDRTKDGSVTVYPPACRQWLPVAP